MKKPPLFKLSELLKASQNNPDVPRNFMSDELPRLIPEIERIEHSIGHIIGPLFEYHRLPRKSILQQAGKLTTRLWIIEKGFALSHHVSNNHEATCDFHFAGEFIGHLSEYLQNKKSEITTCAYTPLTCWSIHCSDIEYLKKEYAAAQKIIEQIGFCKLTWQYSITERLHRFTPAEHYLYLLEHFPAYFRHVPLQYIASFMNISPGSLSRIRTMLNNNNT